MGNQANWASLLSEQVRQNGRFFFRVAHGIVRDAGTAEDICQQAFARACERREEIDGLESLRAWLAKVVVNESLAMVRRKKIEQRAMGALLELDRRGDEKLAAEAELRQAVVAAMDRLPERARMVVVLRIMQGMSGNEVKDLLECSDAEVSRQLYAGMEILRKYLADWENSVE